VVLRMFYSTKQIWSHASSPCDKYYQKSFL
jgi:hypothetical protein